MGANSSSATLYSLNLFAICFSHSGTNGIGCKASVPFDLIGIVGHVLTRQNARLALGIYQLDHVSPPLFQRARPLIVYRIGNVSFQTVYSYF